MDHFNIKDLYLGIVEYYNKSKIELGVHVLANSKYDGELYDLDLCKYINTTGEDEIYYSDTLIPVTYLTKSRICWNNVSREDALKFAYFYKDKYLKFLRIKHVSLTLKK